MRNFKSIKVKLLLFILIPITFIFLSVGAMVAINVKTATEKQIMSKIEVQTDLAETKILTHLDLQEKLPISLANTVNSFGVSNITKNSLNTLLSKTPLTNTDTIGTGIFMGSQIDGQWYCPYYLKNGTNVEFVDSYIKDNTNEGWYKIGDTQKAVAWSDPYFDSATKITMVTATSPIRDSSGMLLGVATADLDFANIQKIVSEIKVGTSGYAIMVTKDGSYLSKATEKIVADDKGIFPNILNDSNSDLAKAGKEAIANLSGVTSFTDKTGKNIVYFSQIEKTGWIVMMVIPVAEIDSIVNSLMITIVMMFLIAFVILTGIILFVSNLITKPLKPLKEDIEAISQGDFTREIKVDTQDEIGQISTSVNNMVLSLSDVIRKVNESSLLLSSTSDELDATATENSGTVSHVAESATEIATANADLLDVAEKVANATTSSMNLSSRANEQVGIANSLILEVNNSADNGGIAIKNQIEQMKSIVEKTKDLLIVMESLDKKSSMISEIVQAISNIATQTNLLALNAAIEAARAGEQGRGFAVVADEVRKLAEESQKSASNISELISSIQSDTKLATQSTKAVDIAVQEGDAAVDVVNNSFAQITTNIEEVTNQIKIVLVSIEEINKQSEVTTNLTKKLEQIAQTSSDETSQIAGASQQMLASVEEQTSATSALSGLAEELIELVKFFKI